MKRGLWILAGFLLLFSLSLLGAGTWLLKTEQGLEFLLNRASALYSNEAEQQLEFELQEGTLWHGARLSSVLWKKAGKSAELQNLLLRLDLSQVLQGKLVISEVSANQVTVNTGPPDENPEPLVLPDEIDLPLDVELRRLQMGELHINNLLLKNIRAQANLQEQQLALKQLDAGFQDIALVSAANMVLRKPYPIAAVAKAAGGVESLAVNAELDVKGSLERLQLSLLANGRKTNNRKLQAKGDKPTERVEPDLNQTTSDQTFRADAVLLPFHTVPLQQLNLSAKEFDPGAWFEGAPKARLQIEAVVKPDEQLQDIPANQQPNAQTNPQTSAQGSLQVSNKQPGQLTAGRIPVSHLSADFSLKLQQPQQQPQQFRLVLKEVLFSDGKSPAGQANGELAWQAPESNKQAGQPSLPSLIQQGGSRFEFQIRKLDATLFAALRKPTSINATVEGAHQAGRLDLARLEVEDQGAELTGTVKAGLKGKQALDLDLQFLHVNPASYIPGASSLMQGDLNGRLQFAGTLAEEGKPGKMSPAGKLDLDLDNSRLANAPLKMKVSGQGSLKRVSGLVLDLDVVGNTANASGAYGTPADFINFSARLDQLRRLGQVMNLKLDGFASAEGQLQMVGGSVSGQADVMVRQLKLDSLIELESVSGNLRLGAADNSPWVGTIQVGKVRRPGTGGNLLNSLNLQLDGVRSRHALSGQFQTGLALFSRNRPLQGEFQLQGGIRSATGKGSAMPVWQGVLSRLKLSGLWSPMRSIELQQAANLRLGSGLLELLNLQMKGEDGSLLHNRVLKVADQQIQVEGDLPQFSFPRLSPILRRPISVEPRNLVLKADWKYFASPGRVEGRINLQHVSGGLQVLEDSQVDVDIRQMKAVLDFNRTGAALDLDIEADRFGRLVANLALPVAQNPDTKAWSLAGNRPMQGAVAASFTDLNWLGPMISEGVRTGGTGQVAMAIAGTLDRPEVQGRLFAMNMEVFQLDQGVRLEEGNVVVDFTLDRAIIDTLEFTVFHRNAPRRQIEELGPLIQGKGKISARGQWNLTGLNGEIQVSLDQVPLLQRPDRWLVVNSNASIQQPVREGEALRIRGDVKALGAYFEMPEKGPQALGDDVFIKGRSEANAASLPIDLQMQASLGDLFYLNAAGLRTRLTGGLRLVMLEGVGGSGQRRSGRRLTANGTIQTVDGTYRAYGQDLTIDRGVVNFQGPLENPGLNIRAVRKGVAVEAGVEVTGTAQRPKVTLVSDPAVPDSEKLSWMIIGRGSNSADRDSTLLLTAAAAIFGNEDESTTRKIAKSLGIDDLNFSTGSLTAADTRAVGSKVAVAPGADASASIIGSDDPLLAQRIISLGKRISDQVYLSFDQSVTTAASIVKLNYQYSRQLSFIARAGADNAIDVLYQFSFD